MYLITLLFTKKCICYKEIRYYFILHKISGNTKDALGLLVIRKIIFYIYAYTVQSYTPFSLGAIKHQWSTLPSSQSRLAVIVTCFWSSGADGRTICENSDRCRPGLWSASRINTIGGDQWPPHSRKNIFLLPTAKDWNVKRVINF